MSDVFFHIIIVVLLVLSIYLWYTKTSSKSCPVAPKCDCASEIDEGYDMGYADAMNSAACSRETFYDYEDTTAKKYQQRTGSKFVSSVGGQCPPRTKMVKSGKWKGKCERDWSWYQVYRGKDTTGKLFTCTGGRIAKDGKCMCDATGGKVMKGSKCVCDKSKGFKWDSKTRRCRTGGGKTAYVQSQQKKDEAARRKKETSDRIRAAITKAGQEKKRLDVEAAVKKQAEAAKAAGSPASVSQIQDFLKRGTLDSFLKPKFG